MTFDPPALRPAIAARPAARAPSAPRMLRAFAAALLPAWL
ncbi:amino acid-binding protein, partial [Paracidovorax cattleyae]